jgi:glutamyl-tRNA synthetase
MTSRVSRLAPSPTGALHLGNARTFLVNWAIARRNGWRLIMRVEDLDGPRVRPEASAAALDTLRWLGLDFDGAPRYQSHDLEPYRDAMRRLGSAVYACSLSRREVAHAASAPHAGDRELRFPPHLRADDADRFGFDGETVNYRLVVEDRPVDVRDEVLGAASQHPHDEVGDFVVWTRRGAPAYQLAVVVDDARQGVTDVVRGADLLPSAGRQQLLYERLGWAPPRWWHLPLVVGSDGRRLAKRHGDTRLETYRHRGVPAERVIGLLGRWSGVTERAEPMTAADFRERFRLDRLDRCPVTFTQADHEWLCGG